MIDVRPPPAALTDDTLAVSAKLVAQVRGALDAEGFAARLGWVDAEEGSPPARQGEHIDDDDDDLQNSDDIDENGESSLEDEPANTSLVYADEPQSGMT